MKAFVITLVIANLLPLYSLETERIWIFLAPLVVIPAAAALARERATASAPTRIRTVVLLLVAQTVTTEVFLGTYW